MIPATVRYEASFRYENKGEPYFATKPVIAWSGDGAAMVADSKTGGLVAATYYAEFAGLALAEAPVVAAVPGGGWYAEYEGGQDNGLIPVLAWLIAADGDMTPISSDADGTPYDLTNTTDFSCMKSPDSL